MEEYPPDHLNLHQLITTRQIDEAFDYVARVTRSTVGEFLAAPAAGGNGDAPRIEVAVEFFVPPAGGARFEAELDRALVRRGPEYSDARRHDRVAPLRLVALPPGTFHQWRIAWNVPPGRQHDGRWCASRELIESILRQAREGLRETAGVG